MASYSGNPSKRAKLETLPPTTSIILIKDEEFDIVFQRKKQKASNSKDKQKGNKWITSGKETPSIAVMSTDLLTAQLKGDGNFEMCLRVMLRKTLVNRLEIISDHVEFSWNLAFVSETCATVQLSVGGDFFEEFIYDYSIFPLKIRARMEIVLENQLIFVVSSKEMSPSLRLGKTSAGGARSLLFEDELRVEVEKPISTDIKYVGKLTIEIIVIRNVVVKDLPYGTVMGREILEKKLESDFEIIAEDDIRFKCNKVFLAACSNALAGMLKLDCKETKEKAIKLNISAKGVEALLKFIYYSNVGDPMEHPRIALELMEVGNTYGILGLQKIMKDIFLGKQHGWFDFDTALLLYLWTLKVDGNEDLKWKAIQVFKSIPDELKKSSEFDKLLKESPQTAKELFALCFKTPHTSFLFV